MFDNRDLESITYRNVAVYRLTFTLGEFIIFTIGDFIIQLTWFSNRLLFLSNNTALDDAILRGHLVRAYEWRPDGRTLGLFIDFWVDPSEQGTHIIFGRGGVRYRNFPFDN